MIFLGGIIFISLSLSCNKCKVFIFLTIKKYWPLFFIDNYIGFLTHAGKEMPGQSGLFLQSDRP